MAFIGVPMSVVIVTLQPSCFFCVSVPFNEEQYPEKFRLNGCSSWYSCGTAATENNPFIVLVLLVRSNPAMQKMEKPHPSLSAVKG